MSEFRTIFDLPESSIEITPNSRLLALGSCFAEEIGLRLSDRKFHVDLNPFGILFNPVSIAKALEYIGVGRSIDDAAMIRHDGLWHSLLHHGSFSHRERDQAWGCIEERIQYAHRALSTTNTIILTLGSSHAYRHLATKLVVANCHKIPNNQFKKIMLDLDFMVDELRKSIELLSHHNPKIKFLVSVSPVRYWRDGAIENQRSKARLIMCCEQLCDYFQNVEYFPAYELVIDDLRDYRFYSKDLVHPNAIAIDYVWEHFTECCFSDEALNYTKEIESFSKLMAHVPIHPDSDLEKDRIQRLQEMIHVLEEKYPDRDFSQEKRKIGS